MLADDGSERGVQVVRRIVPLGPGEVRARRWTSSGLEIPDGYREETDEEFAARIRELIGG
jgi:hypothetical protein